MNTITARHLRGATAAGTAGPPGAAGATGATGPRGLTGTAGALGQPGQAGVDGALIGAAGGALTGNFPNPTLAAGSVTPSVLALAPASNDQIRIRVCSTSLITDGAARSWRYIVLR